MENYKVVHLPPKTIIGIECQTSDVNDISKADIARMRERFFNENVIGRIPNKASPDIYALFCDYVKDFTQSYTYVLGMETSNPEAEAPEGLVVKRIPESSYAYFESSGMFPDCLKSTWHAIWQSKIKRSYIADFEVYGERFEQKDKFVVEVYIGIGQETF